jgi:phosphoglycolate phosphatase
LGRRPARRRLQVRQPERRPHLRLRFLVLGLSPYRHFIFDLDGTVVDSGSDLVRATNDALGRLGLEPLPFATVIGFVGQGLQRLLARSIETAGGRPEVELERASAAFAEIYGAGLLDQTRPYPGMEPALRALAARGAALSVLTNKPRRFTEPILRGLGLDTVFVASVCGDDPLPRKPAPDGALALVRTSGMPASCTLLVGDSAEDVETARAAGLASCAVTWGFRSRDELARARPDHQVSAPDELLALA